MKRWQPSRQVAAVGGGSLVGAWLLVGCASDHSILNAQSDEAGRIAFIGWLMFAIAAVVFVLVMTLLVIGLLRRRPSTESGRDAASTPHDTAPAEPVHESRSRNWIYGGGIALPSAVLLLMSILTVWALAADHGEPELHVKITAHQYWWEVDYGDAEVVTANEFHIPVGKNVELTLESSDVIHSLWVPQLGPKRDLIPGQTNRLTWRANASGEYRGQCAEFCGLQHANMALTVVAQPVEEFDAWISQQAADAEEPSSSEARAGRNAFLTQPCASCHTVRGTDADGRVGPDLTHVASRRTIGAGVAPFDDEHLSQWVDDSQSLKPGNLMPPFQLPDGELDDIVAYLKTLR